MGRTWVRQDAQIQGSVTFDDTVSAGSGMETSASIEADLNNMRSQIKRMLDHTAGNWYDDVPTVNSKQRSLKTLNTDLDDLEIKKILSRVNVLTNVTVGASDNFVVLDHSAGETPTVNKASGATTEGAVTVISALSGVGFQAHELIEVAGADALNPANLVVVRDATTGQKIQSSSRDVFGLLQVESGSVDDEAFSDTATKRAKISFVRPNSTFDDLEAVPVNDIKDKVLNYAYVRRIEFDNMPESFFLSNGNFVDRVASVDVTRENAYTNQGTTPVELSGDAYLDLGASVDWIIRDAANAILFQVNENSSGSATTFNVSSDVDNFDIDAADNDFANGIAVGSSGTEITINETASEINRAADLRLKATGSGELYFADSNEPAGWSLDGIKLSETSANWTDFEAAFGEVSLMEAIIAANSSSVARTKTYSVVTAATIAADANAGGPATAANLDTDLPAMTGWTAADTGDATFVSDNDVYLNGVLLRGGTSASSNHDFYPGTTSAQLKFEFLLRGGGNPDVLCVVTYS